jgi:hypothetical protein
MSGERRGGVVAKTAARTGQEVVLSEHLPSELTDPKFTAAQIESDCPPRLQDLAKEITEGLEKVYEQKKLAARQVIAVKKLINEVKALCDPGGFAAFREKFFPNLRKSRVYELLAIASKKKTIEETRASNRLRVARHRSKKTEAPDSITVAENSEPAAQGSPEGVREIEAPNIASGQAQEGRDRRRCVQSTEQRAPRNVDTDTDTDGPESSTETYRTKRDPLTEFKYAVNHWLPRMDDDTKREAVEYAIAKSGVTVSCASDK